MSNFNRETAEKLKQVFTRLQITDAVFDVDGTLIDTHRLFSLCLRDEAALLLFRNLYKDLPNPHRVVTRLFKQHLLDAQIQALRATIGVRPAIMYEAARMVAAEKNLNHNLPFTKARIDRLYTADVPRVYPRVRTTLNTIGATGARITAATHAERPWTNHKLNSTGLSHKFDEIICFDVGLPKSDQWQTYFQGGDGRMVVGDNHKADLVWMTDRGARGILVINGQKHVFGADEHVLHDAKINPRVTICNQIGEIIPTILKW